MKWILGIILLALFLWSLVFILAFLAAFWPFVLLAGVLCLVGAMIYHRLPYFPS